MYELVMAAVLVAATLVTLTRVIGIKRVLRHATLIDVLFTVLAGVMFLGTLSGMLIAVIGGLLMALTLSTMKTVQKLLQRGADVVGDIIKKKEVPTAADQDPAEYSDGVWYYNTPDQLKGMKVK